MLTLGSAQDKVRVSFFDTRGRCVQKVELPNCKSGTRYVWFSDRALAKGTHLYKVIFRSKNRVQTFKGKCITLQ